MVKNYIVKFMTSLMGVLIIMSTVCFNVSADTTVSHLQNTYSKIQSGETVNIAYLGGSITNGYPNCIQENSWRQRTFDWIKEQFPQGEFNQIHAAMGGTGSDLNCYNIDQSLKLGTTEQPDLLFLEFAVNDFLENLTYEQAGLYYETIIRKCYEANPYMDIICIITTASDGNLRNKRYDTGRAHSDIAALYDLPCIWLADYLWPHIISENNGRDDFNGNSAVWLKYFDDGVHPGVKGHELYFEYIRDNILKPEFDKVNGSNKAKKVLPTAKYSDDYMETRSISMVANPIVGDGFKLSGQYSTAQKAGASFKATFTGTAFGFMYVGDKTNGTVTFSVDGGKAQTVDLYKNTSNSTEYIMLAENLENKQHTIEVKTNETENGNRLWIKFIYTNGDKNNVGVKYISDNNTSSNVSDTESSIIFGDTSDDSSDTVSDKTDSTTSEDNNSTATDNSDSADSSTDNTVNSTTDNEVNEGDTVIKEQTQYVVQKGKIPTSAIIILSVLGAVILGVVIFWIIYFIRNKS